MVDRDKHKIDIEKLKDKFTLDINNYFSNKRCSFNDFDINEFLKGENKHYSMFIIKEEIEIRKYCSDEDILVIPFKINNEIIPMYIRKNNP